MKIAKVAFPAMFGLLLVGVLAWTLRAEAPAEGSKEAAKSRRGEGTKEAPAGRRGEAGKEGPGRFDPEQFRRMMSERMREMLGATEEEWKVLEPKIEAVQTASRELRAGGFGFGPGGFGPGGRGGFGPGGPGREGPRGAQETPQSPVAKAAEDLRTTLEDTNASAEAIAQKLAALRKARDTARENLARAQADLRELLTKRQEAQLVLMGILD